MTLEAVCCINWRVYAICVWVAERENWKNAGSKTSPPIFDALVRLEAGVGACNFYLQLDSDFPPHLTFIFMTIINITLKFTHVKIDESL
jgi:hypothetical protein